jgi:hypothetical protein
MFRIFFPKFCDSVCVIAWVTARFKPLSGFKRFFADMTLPLKHRKKDNNDSLNHPIPPAKVAIFANINMIQV